jgi:glycosyltransferase involved in cell wall biosynthesis
MKSILIIEVEHRGHHLVSYLQSIIKKIQEKKIQCYLITTSEALKSIEYKFFIKSIHANIKVFTLAEQFQIKRRGKFSILLFQIVMYFKIKFLVKTLIKKNINFDLIYINTLDHFEKIFSILGPFAKNIPIICILLNIKFHFNKMIYKKTSNATWIYEFLFKRLISFKNIKKIIVLDELFIKYLKLRNIDCNKKIFLIPEMGEIKIIQNKNYLRNFFKIPKKNKVMLIYGIINMIKGINEAIFSLLIYKHIENLTIMIVGKQDQQIKALMNTENIKNLLKDKKIIIIDEFISEELERKIFSVADFGWAGYVYGSQSTSGFLIQACSAGLPIISNNTSLTTHHVKKNKLGICVDPFDYEKTFRIVRKFIYQDNYKKYVRNCINFSKKRTKKIFSEKLLSALYE